MMFGAWGNRDHDDSVRVIHRALDAGINFVDTADVYSGGESEEILAKALAGRRDDIVLATKVHGRMGDDPNRRGNSRRWITRAVEDSLRRLQIDTIDLYQCHWPDDNTPIDETLAVFGELIASGKVRHIGASNYSATQLGAALSVARDRKLPAFATLQPHHNLVHRKEYEAELAAICEGDGIGVIPYSPLAGGFLTGKYRRGQPLPKSQRADRSKRYMTDQGLAVIDELDRVAKSHATTIAAVALAWQLTRPAVTAPIIGANTVAQLNDLLPAGDLLLSKADVAALNAASLGT
jgi:aryl-alcohol dehydrogenase-like predicted oxidoreductase